MSRWMLSLMATCMLAGCGQHEYSGYSYRSYEVRGVRYTPMSPGQAPGYAEEGVASHYREGCSFFPGPTAPARGTGRGAARQRIKHRRCGAGGA